MGPSGLDVAASAFSATATAAALANSDYTNIVLTPEELKAFHNIDRRLYSKLLGLGRDRVQTLHVMALFMWLERGALANKLVFRLCSWPDNFINSIADEAVLCLKCIQNDHSWIISNTGNDIPTIKVMTNSDINLKFFYSNREKILPGLQHIIDQICLKAFEDIMQQPLVDCKQEGNQQNLINFSGSIDPRKFSGAVPISVDPNNAVYFVPGVGYYTYNPENKTGASSSMDPVVGGASPPPSPSALEPVNTPPELEVMKKSLGTEMENVLDRLQLDHPQDDAKVPIDAKTIFLTFSKGYPISEEEIRNFFNRKFGDIIEALHMQQVPRKKQPLYALLVVNRPSDMDVVFGGIGGRIKFSVNGKHLLARKYFSKKRLPSSKASPSSSPPSQA